MVLTYGAITENMKVIGWLTRCMVVEYTNGARAVNMKANTKTIISMDSAAIPGQMAANI